MEISQKYSQMWWEDAGQLGMQGKSIDASIWSRSMGARFPKDWRESLKTENQTNITLDKLDHLLLEIDGKTKSI